MEGPESARGFAWPEDIRSGPRQMFVDLIHTSFAKRNAVSGSAEDHPHSLGTVESQPKNSRDREQDHWNHKI
jgi:hypothetical protein